MSTALAVSDADSCAESLPLKGLRKVTTRVFFPCCRSSRWPTQIYKYIWKKQRLIGLRRLSNVKQLSNGEHAFLSKDTGRRESVTFQTDWKSLIPSCTALGAIRKPCSLQGLHSPVWFKSAVGDTGCLRLTDGFVPNSGELFIWQLAPRGQVNNLSNTA